MKSVLRVLILTAVKVPPNRQKGGRDDRPLQLLMDERAAVESAAEASSHTRPRPQQTDMRSTDRYLSQKKSG